MLPLCTLYGCTIYSNVGVYSVCFFSKAVEGREIEQAEVKHPRFLFVVSRMFYLFVLDACGQLLNVITKLSQEANVGFK